MGVAAGPEAPADGPAVAHAAEVVGRPRVDAAEVAGRAVDVRVVPVVAAAVAVDGPAADGAGNARHRPMAIRGRRGGRIVAAGAGRFGWSRGFRR